MRINLVHVAALAAFLVGSTMATATAGPTKKVKFASYDAAAELFYDGAQFIDVRAAHIAERGQVEGAENLPFNVEFTREALAMLAKPGQTVVFYCNDDIVAPSIEAARQAKDWGYEQVYVLRGGFRHWDQASLPME